MPAASKTFIESRIIVCLLYRAKDTQTYGMLQEVEPSILESKTSMM